MLSVILALALQAEPLPTFAAVEMLGPYDLATTDGAQWFMVDDAFLAESIEAASVTTVFDTGEASFVVAGSLIGSDLDAVVLAALSANPVSPKPPSATSEAHPRQPKLVFHLEKEITTSKGVKKKIYSDLEVERIPGESSKEWHKRAERELSDAIDSGWESVP